MSTAKSDSSSKQTDPIGVIALWDSENATLPDGYDINSLKFFINMALKNHDDRFYLEEITAFAPKRPTNLPHGFTFEEVKRENIRCEAADPKSKGCYKFVVTDDRNNEEKIMRNTDAADLQMYIAMSKKILKKESHILIISGDCDFLTFVKRFSSDPNLYFMLAINDNSDHLRLDCAAKATWLWNSSNETVGTMVWGGGPTHEN